MLFFFSLGTAESRSLILFCRGFGFVTFKSAESVQNVLKAHDSNPISIDEKMVSQEPISCAAPIPFPSGGGRNGMGVACLGSWT